MRKKINLIGLLFFVFTGGALTFKFHLQYTDT